jgi:hypothetical protein
MKLLHVCDVDIVPVTVDTPTKPDNHCEVNKRKEKVQHNMCILSKITLFCRPDWDNNPQRWFSSSVSSSPVILTEFVSETKWSEYMLKIAVMFLARIFCNNCHLWCVGKKVK